MTAYEKAVIKAFLNEAYGQMSAEVDGQTIIPGYFDTDSSCPEVILSAVCTCRFAVMINGGEAVDKETLETVKRCVKNRYIRYKHKLPKRKDFYVDVYIPKDMTKPFDITFHTEYPVVFSKQTMYFI